jgi:hypothetical protein
VNLIQAATDSHLWADTYDRKLTDILGVESEIAKTIAEQLQAKSTGHEEQALAVKPTNIQRLTRRICADGPFKNAPP